MMRYGDRPIVTAECRTHPSAWFGRAGTRTFHQPGRSPTTMKTSGAPEALGFDSVHPVWLPSSASTDTVGLLACATSVPPAFHALVARVGSVDGVATVTGSTAVRVGVGV